MKGGSPGSCWEGGKGKEPHTRVELYSNVSPHRATSDSCSTKMPSSLESYSGVGVTGILNV